MDPETLIRADADVDRARLAALRALTESRALSSEDLAVFVSRLEDTFRYNCEHVVPQSWFGKRLPMSGKGAVARATLYFLLRYPREIDNNEREYTRERLNVLLQWHRDKPVSLHEKHRNRTIQRKQGNRNPLIDHPEWAERIDFVKGLR